MALFLVQHGKCVSKEIDPQRGLSEEGIGDVEIIASVAKGYSVPAATIGHSGKKRALQTAEIFAKALAPSNGVIELSNINPLDDVELFAKELDVTQNMMLVGHLPFLNKLLSYLVTGQPDNTVFKFQNGGLICLDYSPEDHWFIRWALMPDLRIKGNNP